MLITRHLKDLKEAHSNAVLAGQEDEATQINEKIQETYIKLDTAIVIDGMLMEEDLSRDTSMNRLLKDVEEIHFEDFEREYHLSKGILSAVDDISSAVDLYGHSSTVLYILNLASTKEQHAYIVAWSSILVACAHELQHGAMIWQESVHANVCEQILSQGCVYFIALGEIFRLVKILRISIKHFEPWVLSDMRASSGMLASLEKCAEAWNAGLETALSRTCDCHVEQAAKAKALLESIQRNNEADMLFLQNHAPNMEEKFCKLSLLPVSSVQDMKVVVWNSDYYFVKLATFWAHRVSCDPPQLPCIRLG